MKIWLVEDHAVYAAELARMLPRYQVVCERTFGSCEQLLVALRAPGRPDAILMDIRLPLASGIDALKEVRQIAPNLPVIMLTSHESERYLDAAAREGANGYLLKSSTPAEIATALKQVLGGGAALSPQIAKRLLAAHAQHAPASDRADFQLTQREVEVLRSLANGLSKKEIASSLGVSFHTVDAHLRHIYGKLGVESKTAAVSLALKQKII